VECKQIKQLKPDSSVVVIHDDAAARNGFYSIETTVTELVAAGYGELRTEAETDEYGNNCDIFEDGEDSGIAVVVKKRADFDRIETALGSKHDSPKKMLCTTKRGRPFLATDKLASKQIQLRVTAEQKQSYESVAYARDEKLSEWIKNTLDAAIIGRNK
jgi:hypothetical protein